MVMSQALKILVFEESISEPRGKLNQYPKPGG
jgi:hypothetical protein